MDFLHRNRLREPLIGTKSLTRLTIKYLLSSIQMLFSFVKEQKYRTLPTMNYASLSECIDDLERHRHLVRIKEELDPNLELAAVHLRIHEAGGPALLFERVKGSPFPAVSNLFGTLERSRFMFRHSLEVVQRLVALRSDPMQALRQPLKNLGIPFSALKALPRKARFSIPVLAHETSISKLPQIKHWPKDGGPFVTLPVVYSEDLDHPGVMYSNIGMYRIQLGGNEYIQDKEIGLHYQLHRGIGVHQTKANSRGLPLKVSIFVGGPPSLSFGAVMPLPEGLSELTFAGVLGGRRFRYAYRDGYCLAADADFVITGEVHPFDNKPEGPFGDHLGYYSLQHPFPVMRVHKVWHRRQAIWPFTVVGRPPQEDTSFGALVHELTGNAIPDEIPGLKEVHAVDASGVHPLLVAIGSERYTPYLKTQQPAEILTQANHILGFGQLSLAKYLFIAAAQDDPKLSTHDLVAYFSHIFSRVDFSRDLHFHTNTSIDTLDYSGSGLNTGSKVVVAAVGEQKRQLCTTAPSLQLPNGFEGCGLAIPGVITVGGPRFTTAEMAANELDQLTKKLEENIQLLNEVALIVICDDARFTAATLNNWLWVTFTRSNPSHDIYGIQASIVNKHWGCKGPLIIDARIKPHHAPVLEKDPATEKAIDRVFAKGGSLHGLI